MPLDPGPDRASRPSWLGRMIAAGPNTRRWVMFSLFWITVTAGAVVILLQPNEELHRAANLEEKLEAVRLEEWLALVLINVHFLFIYLACTSYFRERNHLPTSD